MSKKKYIVPYVLLNGGLSGGDGGTVIGGGTGEGGQLPFPMSFDEWSTSGLQYAFDFNENGCDFQDYIDWWIDCGFDTTDAWNEFNSETPWGSPGYEWEP